MSSLTGSQGLGQTEQGRRAEAASYWQKEGQQLGGRDRLPAISLLPPNRPTGYIRLARAPYVFPNETNPTTNTQDIL